MGDLLRRFKSMNLLPLHQKFKAKDRHDHSTAEMDAENVDEETNLRASYQRHQNEAEG